MNAPVMKRAEMGMFSYSSYVDEFKLYFAYFNKIPDVKFLNGINATNLKKYLEKEYASRIQGKHTRQEYCRKAKKLMTTDTYYILENEMIISLQEKQLILFHTAEQHEECKAMILHFRRFLRKKKYNREIRMVVSGQEGLETRSLTLPKSTVQLTKNYNEDLCELHKNLLLQLRSTGQSGLHLFHGLPGTGKSTYIRHLISSMNKRVVFIPPALASNFDAPQLANLLLAHANAVFVIEDAEELLISRDQGRSSSISMLLNLTDGILGTSLGIQFIATFNTDLSNIDKALLRKGRLLSRYEFKPLSVDRSRLLMEELGNPVQQVNKPMTLADIYNFSEADYSGDRIRRPSIGFLSNDIEEKYQSSNKWRTV